MGTTAPPCVASLCTFCSANEDRAREIANVYLRAQASNVIRHYEIGGEHFATTKGYEAYAVGELARSEATLALQISMQVCGTPQQCYEQIAHLQSRLRCQAFVGVFSFAGMPYEEAERSIRLFAREVMPALQKLDPEPHPASALSPGGRV